MLEKQLVPITFDAKMDNKIDPKLNPGLMEVQNMFRKRTGEYRVRYGYTQLPSTEFSGYTWNENVQISSFKSQLVAISDDGIMTLSDIKDKWKEIGNLDTLLLSYQRSDLSFPTLPINEAHSAKATNGVVCTIVYDSIDTYARMYVHDGITGSLISTVAIGSGSYKHLIYAVGNDIFVVKYNGATNFIYRYDTTSASIDSFVDFVIISTMSHADICSDGTNLFLVGRNGNNYYIYKYDIATLTLQDTSAAIACNNTINDSFGSAAGTLFTIKIAMFGTGLVVVDGEYANTSGASRLHQYFGKTFLANLDLDISKTITNEGASPTFGWSTATPTYKTNGLALYINGSTVNIYITDLESVSFFVLNKSKFILGEWEPSTTSLSITTFDPNIRIRSNIVTYKSSIVCLVSPKVDSYSNTYAEINSSIENSLYLYDLTQQRSIALVLSGTYLATQNQMHYLNSDLSFSVCKIAEDTYSTPIWYLPRSNYDLFSSVTFNDNEMIIPSGVTLSYDGYNIFMTSFGGESQIGGAVDTPGSGVGAGSYYYYLVKCYFDANGAKRRSVISTSNQITLAGASTVGVRIKNSPLDWFLDSTNNPGDVVFEIYRSSAAQPVPYLITRTTSTSYIDSYTDSNIAGNAVLYTYGGELEAETIAGAMFVRYLKNRCLVTKSDDPYNIYYSKSLSSNYAVEFSQYLFVQAFEGEGKVVAVETIDDKFVVFKEKGIFYFAGEFANDLGIGQNFSDVTAIHTNVGIEDIRSLVKVPDGLMFKGTKGFYLLDRGMNLTYIGAPVERFNSITISSAVLVEDLNQVRFTSTSGTCLVYDYEFAEWYVWTNIPAVSATVWQGKFVYAKTDGTFFIEDSTTYTDNGTVIIPKIITGWLSFGGLQGFQRVYKGMILGEYRGTHTLKVSIATDFKPYYDEQLTVSTNTYLTGGVTSDTSYYGNYATGSTDSVYQFIFKPKNQKCESMRFMIEGNFVSGNEGFTISGLSLEVGVKKGMAKLSQKNMS